MSLRKNTVWNVAGNAIPMVIGALTIPYLIKQLGMERFGILTLVWTIIGYFSLFDFGIGRAITQQVAECLGQQRKEAVPAIIKAGLQFTLLTGAVGAALLAATAYLLSYHGLNISPGLRQEAMYSLLIAALGIPLATFNTGLRGAFEAFEYFHWSNLTKMFLGLSLFLFPCVAIVVHGNSLITVTAWLVAARFISCAVSYALVLKLPSGAVLGAKIVKGVRRKLFAFGAWMALTNLVSPLLVNLDRFIISYLLGATMVAFYTVPFEFLVRLLIIPGALGTSLLPNLARDFAVNPMQAQKTMWRSTKVIGAIMLALCLVASGVSYPLMAYFLSPEFASKSWPIVIILSFGVLVNGLAYIPYTALHAQGLARATGLLHVAELVVYVPVLIILIKQYGLTGAAIAWSLRTMVDALGLFYLFHHSRRRYNAVSPVLPGTPGAV